MENSRTTLPDDHFLCSLISGKVTIRKWQTTNSPGNNLLLSFIAIKMRHIRIRVWYRMTLLNESILLTSPTRNCLTKIIEKIADVFIRWHRVCVCVNGWRRIIGDARREKWCHFSTHTKQSVVTLVSMQWWCEDICFFFLFIHWFSRVNSKIVRGRWENKSFRHIDSSNEVHVRVTDHRFHLNDSLDYNLEHIKESS